MNADETIQRTRGLRLSEAEQDLLYAILTQTCEHCTEAIDKYTNWCNACYQYQLNNGYLPSVEILDKRK